MQRSFLVVSLTALLFLAAEVLPAAASGPWRAQIVDAETKQALQGVVVLAVWTRHVRGLGGPSSEYHHSEEVLTDQDGRFTIPARSFFSLNPLVFFRGPRFLIFKPGYGWGIWPGGKQRERWPEEDLENIVIELPRLKTLDERKEYLSKVGAGFSTVPPEKTPLLEKAITEERRAVGFRN